MNVVEREYLTPEYWMWQDLDATSVTMADMTDCGCAVCRRDRAAWVALNNLRGLQMVPK